MRSRMTDAQLAKLKSNAKTANEIHRLAVAANGHEATPSEKRKAQAELERRLGKRGANRAKEDALQRAGARPKGIRRLFG